MRYIGNKENIIESIDSLCKKNGVEGKSFFDFFTGTTNVAKYYKEKGLQIYSSDLLYLSYCLQKAYIENNAEPSFETLLPILKTKKSDFLFERPLDTVIAFLNDIPDEEGFIYKNYCPSGTSNLKQPRMYFSDENGKRIDAIRIQIENWKNASLITMYEYFILLACLIETVSFYANVAGVYSAFYKKWDPRAIKRLELRTIKIINNNLENYVYNENSLNLLNKIDVDILYLDPPYNERQYLPNYHVVETIAKYDSPKISGVTGMRDYKNQKSSFCNSKTALEDLEKIAQFAKYKFLILSYNSEGIMNQSKIIDTLSKYGKVILEEFKYTRFKSNNKGLSRTKKNVLEQVYILKKG